MIIKRTYVILAIFGDSMLAMIQETHAQLSQQCLPEQIFGPLICERSKEEHMEIERGEDGD